MAQSVSGGFQDGFLEIVEEELRNLDGQIREFDERIKRKQEEIAGIRVRRDAVIKQAEKLRDLLATTELETADAVPDVHSPVATRRHVGGRIADADAVVELIREQGAPMHYRAIHQTLVDRGFEIGGKGNPDTLLSRYFNDPRLVRVYRGTYGLSEQSRNAVVERSPEAVPLDPPRGRPLKIEGLPVPPSPRIDGLSSSMTLPEKAAAVLRHAGKPLHYGEITRRILGNGAWDPITRTPKDSVSAAIVVEMQKHGNDSTFVRTDRGIYGLREWAEEAL